MLVKWSKIIAYIYYSYIRLMYLIKYNNWCRHFNAKCIFIWMSLDNAFQVHNIDMLYATDTSKLKLLFCILIHVFFVFLHFFSF
jgi:hypothetical protein